MAELFFFIAVVIFCIDCMYPEFQRLRKERKRKITQTLQTEMHEVDRMTGENFEKYLLILFQAIGYQVESTPGSQDYGADLILYKNGMKIAVQAKRYKNTVGVRAVQEVVSSVKYYKANKAMVITNNRFTENACILARCNSVELCDREKLMDLIILAKNNSL